MKGFMNFIREQNAVGLAVAFILGVAINDLVKAIVEGLVNPLIAAFFDASSLSAYTIDVGEATLLWGNVVALLVNFVIVAAVVYFGLKGLGFIKSEKKAVAKEAAKPAKRKTAKKSAKK